MTVWTSFQWGGMLMEASHYDHDWEISTPLPSITTTHSHIISSTLNNEFWRMSEWILINTKIDPIPGLVATRRFRSSTNLIHFQILLSNIISADCFAIYIAAKATERWWYTSTVPSASRCSPQTQTERTSRNVHVHISKTINFPFKNITQSGKG